MSIRLSRVGRLTAGILPGSMRAMLGVPLEWIRGVCKRVMVINGLGDPNAANCRRRVRLALFWLGLSLIASPAWGWGGTGHRMICEIAWQHLTPAARREVQGLLRVERGSSRFNESCTWADRIRGDSRYDFLAPWHYLNLPPGTTRYRDRHCPRQGCVVRAIEETRAILADSRHSRRERLDALRLLGHFVGDVHQPLHVSHARDHGGTLRTVRYGDDPAPISLHKVWDDRLLDHWDADWRPVSLRMARALAMDERRLWSKGDAADWAMESFRLTEDQVYPQALDDVIDASEIAAAQRLVETRLRQAGWRLAGLLNSALDP